MKCFKMYLEPMNVVGRFPYSSELLKIAKNTENPKNLCHVDN